MAEYASSLTTEERDRLAAESRLHRPGRQGALRSSAQVQAAMRENKLFLRGKINAHGDTVWDVVKVSGGEFTLYAKNLPHVGEAAELAVQCMRGRVFVSIAGARALLVAGQHGALAPPREVNPMGPRVSLVPRDGRELPTIRPDGEVTSGRSLLIEVRPGAPEKPRIVVAER